MAERLLQYRKTHMANWHNLLVESNASIDAVLREFRSARYEDCRQFHTRLLKYLFDNSFCPQILTSPLSCARQNGSLKALLDMLHDLDMDTGPYEQEFQLHSETTKRLQTDVEVLYYYLACIDKC
jgi:hypothetical protein